MIKKNGISLITLIIVIVVVLILAGTIIKSLNKQNVITSANNAAFLNNVSELKEGIEIYKDTSMIKQNKSDKDEYPLVKKDDGSYITLNDLSDNEKSKLNNDLKEILYKTENENDDNSNIPNLSNIDYSKFYKLDSDKVGMNIYKDDLYMYINKANGYRVFNIKGIKYNNDVEYSIIPLSSVIGSKYIALSNNTFKLYGDDTLKVLGQINDITTQTDQEKEQYAGLKDFAVPSQIPDSENIKKVYFSSGTAYVIDKNDDLWAWGDNYENKLGQGNSYNITVPLNINKSIKDNGQIIKAKNVWAGNTNTWILDTNNNVWACGSNSNGCLGQGNLNKYDTFIKITQIDGNKIKNIYPGIGITYTLIEYNDGTVYGCGGNFYGTFANDSYDSDNVNFIKLDAYSNSKEIISGLANSYMIDKDNNLYACGYNGYGNVKSNGNEKYSTFIKIASNVEDASYCDYINSSIIFKSFDGTVHVTGLYRNDSNGNRIYDLGVKDVDDIKDNGVIVDSGGLVYKDGKAYIINYDSTLGKLKLDPYYSEYSNISEKCNFPLMRIFKSSQKYYIENYPDLTRIGSRVRLSLKTVFYNAIFVQGMEDKISIVDNKMNIWESLTYKNTQLTNVKKILSSETSKYALLNDGTLYAKGGAYTGCWGDVNSRDSYVKVTKDGSTTFDNIKDIYTTNTGNSVIILTSDNKLYWAGTNDKISFPGDIKGDIDLNNNVSVTKYPIAIKNSIVLDKIVSDIKDICYTSYWTSESYSKLTFILTNVGDLYVSGDSDKTTGLGKKTDGFEKITCFNSKVKSISTFNNYSMALLENGDVYAWGYNDYGQFGDGYKIGEVYQTPQKLNKISNIEKITLGNGFVICADENGKVYGAGRNEFGQLGDNTNNSSDKFVECIELEK